MNFKERNQKRKDIITKEVSRIMEECNFSEDEWIIAFSEEFVHIIINNSRIAFGESPSLNTKIFKELDWLFKTNGTVNYEKDHYEIQYEDYIYGNVMLWLGGEFKMAETIKNIILCMDGGDIVAHAVETTSGMVIGTQIGVSHKSKHEIAKDIQELFDISPMEHMRLMQEKTLMLNPSSYQSLLDSCKPISWDEAERKVK